MRSSPDESRSDRPFEELRIELHSLSPDPMELLLRVSGPGEELLHKGTFRVPVRPSEMDRALMHAMRTSDQWIQRNQVEELSASESRSLESLDPVKNLGAKLFSALFEGRLELHYRRLMEKAARHSRGGVCLRFVVSEGVAVDLPWEFLFDPRRQDFVALTVRSPLVRQLLGTAPSPSLRVTPPLRLLVAGADVTGSLGVEEEVTALEAMERRAKGLLELHVVRETTEEKLLTALRDGAYHVLHFIGTGLALTQGGSGSPQALAMYPAEGAAQSAWSHDLLKSDRLLSALEAQKELRLVFLSACKTDLLASALSRVVPAVLGMRGDPRVDVCQKLAERFYAALLNGQRLEAALTEGRQVIDELSPGWRQWGLPVCYVRSSETALLVPQVEERATGPATLRAEQEVPADRRREWKRLTALLLIRGQNLRTLEEQQDLLGDTLPELVRSQIEDTREEIARLKSQLNALLE